MTTDITGTVPAQVPGQINISELELRMDMVRMSPQYYSLIDAEVQGGAGVTYDINVTQSIPFSISNSSASPAQRSFQVSQPVRFLKAVSAVTRLQADLNSIGAAKAKFGNHMFGGFGLQINGIQYPQQPVSKTFDAFQEMRKANGMLASLVGDSIIDQTTWRGPYGNIGKDAVVAPARDGTWWGSEPLDPALFIPGVSLESFPTSSEADLQGINLLEAGGSMVNVMLTNAPSSSTYNVAATAAVPTAAAAQVLVLLHYTGILSIAGGAVTFER